jgi:hypothetical protein
MDLGGRESSRRLGMIEVLYHLWGVQGEKSAAEIIFHSSGPPLHPGSLAAVLLSGPDHLLPRPLFQLWPLPLTDATPLTTTLLPSPRTILMP